MINETTPDTEAPPKVAAVTTPPVMHDRHELPELCQPFITPMNYRHKLAELCRSFIAGNYVGKPYARARMAFAGAIVMQLTVIGTMVSVSAYTLCIGEMVQIKTKIVDPWDMFRGDYVTLNYDPVIPDTGTTFCRNDTIYVTAKRQGQFVIPERGYGRMPTVDHSKYVVLRGKVDSGGYAGSPICVHYGIERYYIPERTGSRFNDARQLVADVAVDNFGHCSLKDVTIIPAAAPAK